MSAKTRNGFAHTELSSRGEARTEPGRCMRDHERLRKEADRLLADAVKADREGKSELAKRLLVRAGQSKQDAAVIETVEIRLQAERAKTYRRPKLSVVARNDPVKR